MINLDNVLNEYKNYLIEGDDYLIENGLKMKDDFVLNEFSKAYMKALEIIDAHNLAFENKEYLNKEELFKLNENVLIFKQIEVSLDKLIIDLKGYLVELKKDDVIIKKYKQRKRFNYYWLFIKITIFCLSGWLIAKYVIGG